DLIAKRATGSFSHTLLAGMELGLQDTANFRQWGFFRDTDLTSGAFWTPVSRSDASIPIILRQRESDISNHGRAASAAIYAQDLAQLSSRWSAVLGLRAEVLEVDFTNDRTRTNLRSRDTLWSPRIGLIYKLREDVSFYANATRAHLPRSGERLSS